MHDAHARSQLITNMPWLFALKRVGKLAAPCIFVKRPSCLVACKADLLRSTTEDSQRPDTGSTVEQILFRDIPDISLSAL